MTENCEVAHCWISFNWVLLPAIRNVKRNWWQLYW